VREKPCVDRWSIRICERIVCERVIERRAIGRSPGRAVALGPDFSVEPAFRTHKKGRCAAYHGDSSGQRRHTSPPPRAICRRGG
jgi:hypothetical protein